MQFFLIRIVVSEISVFKQTKKSNKLVRTRIREINVELLFRSYTFQNSLKVLISSDRDGAYCNAILAKTASASPGSKFQYQ